MIKESIYCSKVIETRFNKPLALSQKDLEDFKDFAKCCICQKAYIKGKVKVKNHNHITGKYKKSLHQ